MAVLSQLLKCCCVQAEPDTCSEKLITTSTPTTPYSDHPTTPEVAQDIVHKLFSAKRNDAALRADLQSTIHTYGWSANLAAAILAALENAIKVGEKMGPAMKTAYDDALAAVHKVEAWADAHPDMAAVIVTLVALGVVAVMVPWAMAYLGFAEEGIVEGSWAAGWQSTYRGFVPKGSLFSYLQSLGTKIGRGWRG